MTLLPLNIDVGPDEKIGGTADASEARRPRYARRGTGEGAPLTATVVRPVESATETPYGLMLIPELSPRSTYPRFVYLTLRIRLRRWYLVIDPEGWWRWRRTLVKVYDGTTMDRHDYR